MADHFTPFAKSMDAELIALLARQQRALISLWLAASIFTGAALCGSCVLLIKRAPEIARAAALERPA